MTTTNQRQELGEFMHMVCFQYLRTYTEEVAGRAPIVAAGRKRGYDVIEGLGLLGSTSDPAQIYAQLNATLGAQGTKLCLIQRITVKPNGGFEVTLTDSACTGGVTADEPICAFTLGVFVGAFHALTGVRMTGHETACQACGAPMCVYQIDPV
jgi:V4R domain